MIYFLYGDNTEEGKRAVHTKTTALVSELIKKRPDASLFTLTDENWNEAAIEEYTGGQGLFERKYIVVARDIFSTKTPGGKERRDTFLDTIELFAESPNIFIFAESFLDKTSLKKIRTHATKVQEIKSASPSQGAAIPYNVFGLADALGARDKKKLWILYRTAIESGKVPEEIHGLLFWQVKSMILSKRYGGNFTPAELRMILQKLVSLYHDAHRGMHDFETALEIFILEL